MEDYGRELYKLKKVFSSKAKQKAREKDKDKVAGGPKRDVKDSRDSMDVGKDYAPLKLASVVLDGVKDFQVYKHLCKISQLLIFVLL